MAKKEQKQKEANKRIEFKRKLEPQNRPWQDVAAMLIDRIDVMPLLLMCKGCKGEHMCSDKSLTIHCVCGMTTTHTPISVFYGWSSLTWSMLVFAQRSPPRGDTNAYRNTMISAAAMTPTSVLAMQPRHIQQPLDTRVQLWRLRAG